MAELLSWRNGSRRKAACPACGAISSKNHVVSVRVSSLWQSQITNDMDFFLCEVCHSIFPCPFSQPTYDDDYGYPDYVRFYCELGAGIDFMIRPILAVQRLRPIRSFIDAGCGFGFTLDFVQRMLGAQAIGFDPSKYAREGARLLQVNIKHEYLTASTQTLTFDKADMLLCSEVIERVEGPLEFVKMLHSKVSPDGVLVITTPSAGWVTKDVDLITILEILFPGFHRQIFSANALRTLLELAGFKFIDIREERHRLIAFASQVLDISRLEYADEASRAEYRQYLLELVSAFHAQRGPIFSGAVYRAFKEAVNAGDRLLASMLRDDLLKLLREELGFDVTEQDGIQRAKEGVLAASELSQLRPYHLPCSFFYLGMIELVFLRNFDRAAAFFQTAGTLIRHVLRNISPTLVEPASLYWPSIYHTGVSHLMAGRREESLLWFQRIFEAADRMPDDLVQTQLFPRDIARAQLQAGIAHLQMGQMQEAAVLLKMASGAGEGALTGEERAMASSLFDEAWRASGLFGAEP